MIPQFGNVVLFCSLSWKLIDRILNILFHNYIGRALLRWEYIWCKSISSCKLQSPPCIVILIQRREFSGCRRLARLAAVHCFALRSGGCVVRLLSVALTQKTADNHERLVNEQVSKPLLACD